MAFVSRGEDPPEPPRGASGPPGGWLLGKPRRFKAGTLSPTPSLWGVRGEGATKAELTTNEQGFNQPCLRGEGRGC